MRLIYPSFFVLLCAVGCDAPFVSQTTTASGGQGSTVTFVAATSSASGGTNATTSGTGANGVGGVGAGGAGTGGTGGAGGNTPGCNSVSLLGSEFDLFPEDHWIAPGWIISSGTLVSPANPTANNSVFSDGAYDLTGSEFSFSIATLTDAVPQLQLAIPEVGLIKMRVKGSSLVVSHTNEVGIVYDPAYRHYRVRHDSLEKELVFEASPLGQSWDVVRRLDASTMPIHLTSISVSAEETMAGAGTMTIERFRDGMPTGARCGFDSLIDPLNVDPIAPHWIKLGGLCAQPSLAGTMLTGSCTLRSAPIFDLENQGVTVVVDALNPGASARIEFNRTQVTPLYTVTLADGAIEATGFGNTDIAGANTATPTAVRIRHDGTSIISEFKEEGAVSWELLAQTAVAGQGVERLKIELRNAGAGTSSVLYRDVNLVP